MAVTENLKLKVYITVIFFRQMFQRSVKSLEGGSQMNDVSGL